MSIAQSTPNAQEWIRMLVLDAAQQACENKRDSRRFTCFHPISVRSGGRVVTGFSRDLSLHGIGILASEPITTSEAGITMWFGSKRFSFDVNLKWHHEMEANCYLYGAQFQEKTALSFPRLILTALSSETERRVQRRAPFFRSASVTAVESDRTFRAFTRDISDRGIGLLHEEVFDDDTIRLEFPSELGQPPLFQAKVLWTRETENGWYTSGCEFEDFECPGISKFSL